MEAALTLFVAGSQKLKRERDVCRTVCNILQNQWGTIITKTFEDFPETISKSGHQKEYNLFISNKADVIIFIFSGKVGDITMSEFYHAYNTFKKNNHPKILVYIDKENSNTEDIIELKNSLSLKGQYYKEYKGLKDLEDKIQKHLSKILISRIKDDIDGNFIKKFLNISKIPLLLIGIWCVLSLIGGIGMYIYDSKMSDNQCHKLAMQYFEYGQKDELIYFFPDETYIYNIESKSFDCIKRKNASSGTNFNYRGIKDVTFASTASLLFTRCFKIKVKGNPKTVLSYIAATTVGIIGVGVGCTIEQMIFPPQYSRPVRKYLSKPSNWEKIYKENSNKWWL